MRRLSRLAVVGLAFVVVTALALVAAPPASAHGYTNAPISRSLFCKQGVVTNCGPIQWEPQSVEGPKGFPSAGPVDGTLCAGGLSRFSQLDDPRGGAWPTNSVRSGQSYQFKWHLTVNHATTDFRYYITKPGWNPAQKLTRSALDLTPFLTVPYGGSRPAYDITHSGTMPSRSGTHLILAVWTIADTGNAFYQCSDVRFS
ncbi:lytic polysaccharide monooxygenase auxiliary activity family 9 protein [Stackebrandtia albiflava]|uniref:lytic polysaccharide monooxygenase auxiliary activity family 9 protein n=1 Tax=Stackebrandtia albiflava TaxID=406432 RepID=UPI003CC7E868